MYTEEHQPVQVLVSIIISSGLYWIGQSEATLLNVSTLFHFISSNSLDKSISNNLNAISLSIARLHLS